MSEKINSITDLPLDILVLVFPYLDAKSFLAFCSTCKAFQQPSIRLDPAYWSHSTRSTFRVPNQPVVQNDGARWQKLYRRLLTQSKVFTWGSNSHQRLGHSHAGAVASRNPRHLGRRRFAHVSHCSFPVEMENTQELGIIADMQCGGWSTTLLTSKGSLHTTGVLNGMQAYHNQSGQTGLQPLRFPVGFPYSTLLAAYEEPTIAIRQFSSGRTHILALSDSGRIWSWYAVHKPALHIKFMHLDITEASSSESSPANKPLYGRVRQVVAGWSRSSAYVYGAGIVIWDPVQRAANENDETDTMLVMESAEVPMTGYQRVKGASRESDGDKMLSEEVGVVLNYIVLENYIVFVTDLGRVFCGKFEEHNQVPDILELKSLRSEIGAQLDVQGSFRSFAVFKNGEVITTNQGYLDACWSIRHQHQEQTEIEGLKKIPALQQNNVISVAFGDYHFLALHSNGKITSYGTELQACGALGLGGSGDPEGRTRGIRYTGFNHDGKLLPHTYTHGRQVWFEQEKRKWITFMTSGGKDPDEAKERMRMFVTDAGVQGEVSEWFEQQGRDWDKEPVLEDADEDGLGSHFALNVSAAGWHSGAVVLVNEKLAELARELCIIKDPTAETNEEGKEPGEGSDQQNSERARNDPLSSFLDPIAHGASPQKGYKYIWADRSFPRLKLSDGREMPGSIDFDDWRFGVPQWQLDVEY